MQFVCGYTAAAAAAYYVRYIIHLGVHIIPCATIIRARTNIISIVLPIRLSLAHALFSIFFFAPSDFFLYLSFFFFFCTTTSSVL
jgi:hypothetical protein